jgi:hypothetical protein
MTLAAWSLAACVSKHVPMPQILPVTADHPYYEIRQPVVNTRLYRYPKVQFKPGDRVTVFEAGGCVNTGGLGKTWKAYVDPKGDQTARLYHGLIWIPGATQVAPDASSNLFVPEGSNPVRLEGVVGKTYIIGPGYSATGGSLYLGYEDDDYRDNGYYKDKAGATPPGQCVSNKNDQGRPHIEPAYVKIRVDSGATPAPQPSAFKSFDVVATELDPNGLLRSPVWAKQFGHEVQSAKDDDGNPDKQVTSYLPNATDECGAFPSPALNRTQNFELSENGKPPCSGQAPSFDVPIDFSINKWVSCFGTKFLNPGLHLNGHANWVPVFYDGQLNWAGEQAFDEDADIILEKRVGESNLHDWSGYSANAKNEVEIEMAGYETWDHFGTELFQQAWATRKQGLPLGVHAQVIGLMSLDCVHGCKVELHPVFAMAIRKQKLTQGPDGTWDDEWAIFARNYGNEGWCSHDLHYLDRRQVTFILPGPANATLDIVGDSGFKGEDPTGKRTPGMTEFRANAAGLGVYGPVLTAQGARITLTLGDPESKTQVNGYLHLKWKGGGPAPPEIDAKVRDLSSHKEEVDIESERKPNPQYDTFAITRLTSEPSGPYVPAGDSKTIVDENRSSVDRSKLKEFCKEESKKGRGHDYCGTSQQLKRAH